MKRRGKIRLFLLFLLMIIIAGSSVVGYKLYQKYSEGKDYANLSSYFKLASEEKGVIMLDGAILEERCRIVNNICYLDIETVQKYLHNRFYYTEVSKEIRYTDALTVVTAPLGGGAWTSTTAGLTENFEESYVIAIEIEEKIEDEKEVVCYIALDFVEKFVPVTHNIFREPDRVVLLSMEACREMSSVKKDTYVRWYGGVKSDILTEVARGEQVIILDSEQAQGWTKVATANGFVGYIRNNKLGAKAMVTTTSTLSYTEPEYTSIQLEEKIRLGFHGIYNKAANANLEEKLETAYNINVISPLWFLLNDNLGNFISFASVDYVEKAHSKGIQVWGMVQDIEYADSINDYEILANSENRTHLIEGLITEAIKYDLDGLNIDLEWVRKKESEHFIQFLRELSIRCREEGLILSVDNYPPNSGNMYFDYKEQGIIVDYVVLMGYDEHWGGSGDPGSTASQPFVEESIDKLLTMVDSSKVINALPFYTRLWKTSGDKVTDDAIFMKFIDSNISELGMNVEYDESLGQKYASVEKNGVLYEMWIEDYASMESKLKAVQERDLAGIAAWRLGYENREVWDLIESYIQ